MLDQAEARLRQAAQATNARFDRVSHKPPVKSDSRLVTAIANACQELSLPYLSMPSGAGHDAMNMAALCPIAMIFVPSHKGVSHSPDEYTTPEACVHGARLLLATLLNVDDLL
ncbi:MAG: M20/M25/M40 family metallo-hydrolase [Caldilineaceae bacterium]